MKLTKPFFLASTQCIVVLCLVLLSCSVHFASSAVHNCSPSVEEHDNTTDLGQVLITETIIDGSLVDVAWLNDSTSPDPVLKESVFVRTDRGTVYRSTDQGKSWTSIMSQLPGSDVKIDGVSGVQRWYATETDILFVGLGTFAWTWNSTAGFRSIHTNNKQFGRIKMHPFRPGWILASTGSTGCYDKGASGPCYGVLYVTRDNGGSWVSILNYVLDYSWGNAKSQSETDETIYATAYDDQRGNQNQKDYWDLKLKKTTDFFKTSNIGILDHCVGFIFTDHKTLWAIQPVRRHDTTLRLFTSTDGGRTVLEAQFPISPDALEQGRYTILDTREGMSFVNVEHGSYAWGHLYASDATDRRYSLSLEYNARVPYGAVDFERLEGIDGIYLANFLDDEGRGRPQTVLSIDKGGEWSHLPPVSEACKANHLCHLHLFGYTNNHPPFYSIESAIGLMLGVGNEGTHLQQSPIDTYISRDAGLTWSLARKGSYVYEFGDHGGIIVMVSRGATNEIVFSWNEGDTWHPCHFTDTPVRLANIMSGGGPSYGSSQQFIAYGLHGDVSVIIHFDFSQLHERACIGAGFPDTPNSDYELWLPGRKQSGGPCLLGRHVGFVRRKPSAQCVNGAFFNRGTVRTRCPCTRADFTCDYCFEVPDGRIDSSNDDCVLSEACKTSNFDPAAVPRPCNGTYQVSRGYRLVVGDACILQNDDPHLPLTKPCPDLPDDDGGGDGGGGGKTALWVGAIIAAVLALIAVTGVVIFLAVKYLKNRTQRFTVLEPAAPTLEEEEEEDGSLETLDNKL